MKAEGSSKTIANSAKYVYEVSVSGSVTTLALLYVDVGFLLPRVLRSSKTTGFCESGQATTALSGLSSQEKEPPNCNAEAKGKIA